LDNPNYEQMEDEQILELITNLEKIINDRAAERRKKAAEQIKVIAARADLDLSSLIPKKKGRPKKKKPVVKPTQ